MPINTYAPALFEKDPRRENVKKAALEAAMYALMARNVIGLVESGPPSKRRQRLVVTPQSSLL